MSASSVSDRPQGPAGRRQEQPLDPRSEGEEGVEHRGAGAGVIGRVAEVLVGRDVADVAVGVADGDERRVRPLELQADLAEELAGHGDELETAEGQGLDGDVPY